MNGKVLLVATVQSHIAQFHRPVAKMLHENGYEVCVAARNNLAEKNGLRIDFADKVFDVPFDRSPFSFKNIGAYKALKKVIDDGSYNIVHCNTPVGGVLTRLASRKARKHGTKIFYTAHGFHFYKGAPMKNWLIWYPVEKLMSRFTDTLITIADEDYALAKAKFPTNSVHIHGVGANSEKYKKLSADEIRALRLELGYKKEEKLLLCTGELLPNKNQLTAIRAMKKLTERFPQARLLLAGNGPALPQLEEEVRSLGLETNVVFLGYRTDLERFANIADVIVSCSFREGMALNIIEGMMLGKPVVASSNRSHRELVVPGETGFIVSPSDADGFAEKISLLLDDSALAEKLGNAGFERAQNYTDNAVRSELEKVYFGSEKEHCQSV